ncbi:MAG: hypothetical protein AVDCRST_MAG18-1891 [uncultured Thermomicrobiales bacterium]|uniref:Uncharacterized protein n=1 Tax=uncultured Thermomicrobiales bacterium TaxID=1645740 RepID=A0A6J4V696_9BACT|nr:MAG: hypothetical protein AVDCRST_MAG18-1891 [uncultured Thermomicrobiales bacterium]
MRSVKTRPGRLPSRIAPIAGQTKAPSRTGARGDHAVPPCFRYSVTNRGATSAAGVCSR